MQSIITKTLQYCCAPTKCYSVLQSATPVPLWTTKYCSVLVSYKVLLRWYSVLQSTAPAQQSAAPALQSAAAALQGSTPALLRVLQSITSVLSVDCRGAGHPDCRGAGHPGNRLPGRLPGRRAPRQSRRRAPRQSIAGVPGAPAIEPLRWPPARAGRQQSIAHGHTGDWTQGLPHAERVWYHYTNCPVNPESNMSSLELISSVPSPPPYH